MSTIRLKHLRYTLMITATLFLIGCGGGNGNTDTTPPVLTLLGDNPMTLTVGVTYTEPGATATDETDGNLTDAITVTGTVDTAHVGDYTRLYRVSDAAGNEANATRTVHVVTPPDTTPPVITLKGNNPMTLYVGDSYAEPGATAVDATDGTVTVTVSGTVDTAHAGDYTRHYQAVDAAGNTASATRTVHVLALTDTTPPIITLKGDNPMTLHVGDTYTELGAEATDDVDGNLTTELNISGTVDTTNVGSYTRLYRVHDAAGNETNTTRLIYVLDNALGNSDFPAAYYPTGAHPRLWLTAERLASLAQHKAQNTDRWQAFKSLCDSMVDGDASNDPWDMNASPQNYTAPLALMYRIENNATYADKALDLMDQIDDNLSRYGDPDHQSYYFMGLTYDWLYDYTGMTTTKKQQYRTLMKKISDKFYTEDLTASGTDSDFNLLTALHHLVMGVATYDGSDANATTMLNRAWKGWSQGYCVAPSPCTTNHGMVLAGLGGVYFTGMAYFPSTDVIGISGFEMSMRSACGYDVNTQEPDIKPFWGHILRAIIALTEPTRTAIFDYGSWQDPNSFRTPYTQAWLRRALIIGEYFAAQADDNASADLARGFNAQVDVGDYNDPFLELFYDTPGTTVTDPYTASLPRITYAESPDFLLARSSWETHAGWAVFRGDGSWALDQRAMDMGSFSLWRNGGYLTKGARNYEALTHGDFFNTLSLENTNNDTAIFNSQKAATIPRHRTSEAPLMAYGMLQADGQWDDASTDNIETYRRHFVWMNPYVVVLDRVRAYSAIDITWRLRALHEPTLSGTTISQPSDNNSSRLLTRIIEPAAGVTLTKVDEATLWSGIPNWVVNASERHWQTQASFSTDTLNILAVMQMGDASLSTLDTLESLSDANNSGVRIGDRVVCFNHAEGLRSDVSYTLHGATAPMRHLVGDLIPGAYRLRIDGVTVETLTVTDEDNTAWFETTATGTITVSLGKTP